MISLPRFRRIPSVQEEIWCPLNPQDDEIRLLIISPGRWDSQLACSLQVVSLNHSPVYSALSYVWGDANVLSLVEINGLNHHLTRNLFEALRRLRLPNEARILWVDAICINQSDLTEKTQQVNMMSRIYRVARETLVWFGDEPFKDVKDTTEPNTSWTATSMASVFESLDMLASNDHPGTILKDIGKDATNGVRESWKAFVHNPWWTRVWTVQEVAVASSVTFHYGPLQLSWDTLENAAKNVHSHDKECRGNSWISLVGSSLWQFHGSMQRTAGARHGATEDNNPEGEFDIAATALVTIMNMFHGRSASDARDRVFAFLGLRSLPNESSFFKADYHLELPEVLVTFTMAMMKATENLYPLLRPREYGRLANLPSWVPDWSARTEPLTLRNEVHRNLNFWNYDAAGQENLDFNIHGSVLCISGCMFDRVFEVGRSSAELLDWDDVHYVVSGWQPLLGLPDQENAPYVAGGSIGEAFHRTLLNDIVWEADDDDNQFPPKIIISRMQTKYDNAFQSALQLGAPGLGKTDGFLEVLIRSCTNRRLFTTEQGFIGLGPTDIAKDDYISVLSGGNVPFVLRSVDKQAAGLAYESSGEPRCSYIGNCYVHGIMDGEAVHSANVPGIHGLSAVKACAWQRIILQ